MTFSAFARTLLFAFEILTTVENLFLESQFTQIYRCALYTTGQTISENEVTFRPIASSPIGTVKGSEFDLDRCVKALTTRGFPFHPEKNIQRDIWKKSHHKFSLQFDLTAARCG